MSVQLPDIRVLKYYSQCSIIELMALSLPDKEFLGTLAKGLSVITVFDEKTPVLTVTAAAAAIGVSRATARRILHTLHQLGYVEQNGRSFSLAPKALDLGYRYLSSQSWIERAGMLLKVLSEEIGESASAAVLQGTEIVYVAHVPSRRLLSVDETIGTHLPAFHTALGRVQLGYLEDADLWARLKSVRHSSYTSSTIINMQGLYDRIQSDRDQGFAIIDEELEKGLRSLAVPVLGRDDNLLGAISISVNATRTTRDYLRTVYLPKLRAVAVNITDGT